MCLIFPIFKWDFCLLTIRYYFFSYVRDPLIIMLQWLCYITFICPIKCNLLVFAVKYAAHRSRIYLSLGIISPIVSFEFANGKIVQKIWLKTIVANAHDINGSRPSLEIILHTIQVLLKFIRAMGGNWQYVQLLCHWHIRICDVWEFCLHLSLDVFSLLSCQSLFSPGPELRL